jgi:hypothetical protein
MIYQINQLVPENYVGKPTNLSVSVIMPSREEALVCFNRATKRMLNPPTWHQLSGWASARFKLAGVDGQEVNRLALEGDYFMIDIPGPGPATGEGFDWVAVEKINAHENHSGVSEWSFIQVRPCRNPHKAGDDTAHFFKSMATSSFIIERNGNIVSARYHGRNEVPNTSTESITDNLRNAAVAAGASVGFSEAQWKALLKGLLSAEIGGDL